MVDTECFFMSLKYKWVKWIISSNASWSVISQLHLNKFGAGYLVLSMNFSNEKEFPALANVPLFYQEIIMAYLKVKNINKEINIMNEIIWGNKIFNINSITLYNDKWIDKGIIYINNLEILKRLVQNYILNKVDPSPNNIFEIGRLIKVIKPHKANIIDNQPNNNDTSEITFHSNPYLG